MRWRDRLLASLVMGDGDVAERIFRARAVEFMLASDDLQGEGLYEDELLVLVEGISGMLPGSRTLALMEATQLLERNDERYLLRSKVAVSDFETTDAQRLSRSVADLEWSLDEVAAVFQPPPNEVAWTVRGVRGAIYGGYCWLLGTLEYEGNRPRYPVLPAFWSCDGETDTPVGMLPAVTSVGDSLSALADGVRSDIALAHVPGDHAPAIGNAVQQLLTYPVELAEPEHWDERMRSWNAGGFMPYDDQPEAAYPTVDATWDALIALSSVVDGPASEFGLSPDLLAAVREQTIASTRFLLRMQLDSGGWGIYRYLDDSAQVPPYDFTTGQTILALSLVLDTNLLAEATHTDLRAEVEASLRRAWSFLSEVSIEAGGLTAWTPYFRQDVDLVSSADLLCSSCWASTGVLALFRLFPDLRAEIAPALADLATLAERHWEPDYGRLADASFRAPLADPDQLNDTFGKWSNRYDVTVGIALLTLFNEICNGGDVDVVLTPGLWERMERTVGNVLDEQHPGHGHWGEPVSGMPLAAATAMALLLLHSYLDASIALASARDVSPQD